MIAILGATGYIGRSLAKEIVRANVGPLWLFARDPAKIADGVWPSSVRVQSLDTFDTSHFTLVINAIGAGDPARIRDLGASLVAVSDAWDKRILGTMNERTRYVFLSSGAIDVAGYTAKAVDIERGDVPVAEGLTPLPPYAAAKARAEARHRQASERPILDLRVFAYADEGIGRDGSSFLAELARSVTDQTPFRTSPADMTRDYAGAEELWTLVSSWVAAGAPNVAADLYSAAPVRKSAILEAARRRYGLRTETLQADLMPPTSGNTDYVSRDRAAARFGYSPRRTSFDIVMSVLDSLAVVRDRRALATVR